MDESPLLSAMQTFVSVVESGSFSESARRLGLSQPSVSRQINALENQLGVRLLQRTTRNLSLTEAGQIYYEKARLIQRAVTEASQAISGFKEQPAGLLRISAPHTWVEAKIAPHLGEFMRTYPDIRLELFCNDSRQDMVEERLDLVIRVGRPADSSYIAIPFCKVKLLLCASPDYLAQAGQPKTPADLHNHSFIVFDKFTKTLFSHKQELYSINLNARLTSNSVAAIISATVQGTGFSVLPDLLIQQELNSGKLLQLMPEQQIEIEGLPVEEVFAMYSSRIQMPAKVRAFLEFFKTRFAE